MKLKNIIFMLLAAIMLSVAITGCSSSSNEKWSASWAYGFVVWNGFIYKPVDESVTEVNNEIGEVTKYSDQEGTYSGNFSNQYEKGTKYFSIKGVSTDEAIAIQEQDGKYRKAIRDGRYGEKK